jgi:HK97 family phage portal protein
MLKHAWRTLSKALGLETRAANISSPDAALLSLFGATLSTISNVAVSPATAMRCAPVRRAVSAISETIGTLPCLIYENDASGARKPAESHPAFALLSRDANPWTPSSRILEQWTRDTLLHGNGYLWVNRIDGVPRELIRLRPETVQVVYDLTTGEPHYTLTNDMVRAVDRSSILHLQAPSVDGICGESPVLACREAIGLNIVMQAHAAKLFAKGVRPSGILSTEKSLGEETLKRLAASWSALNSGDAAGAAAILEEGMKWTPLAFSSVDAQFLELWTFSVNEIARVFGVPPSLLFELGRATWGNASEMGASFLRFTLARWLTAIEGELALKLFAQEERARFCVEFDTDLLLRSDLASRATAYSQLRASGVVTANEIRAWENLPPRPDGNTLESPHVQSGNSNAGAFDA